MPTVDRSRQRLLVASLAAAAVVVLVVIATQTSPRGPVAGGPGPSGSTSSLPAGTSGAAGALIVDAVPAIDPEPWAAVDWREVPKALGRDPEPGLDRVDGLVAGGPGLVGWGRIHQQGRNQFNDMGAVYQSANGIDWTVIPVDAGVGRRDTSEIQLVASGPAGVVTFGDVCCTDEERPALWRSADGRTWQRLPYPAGLGPAGGLTRLVATVDHYVLSGRWNGAAAMWTSKDGATWTAVDGTAAGFGPGTIADVARTPDGLVAAGWLDVNGTYDGAVWTSGDGEHWKRIPADILVGPADTVVERVVPWAGGWFLVGSEGPHADRVRCEQLGLAGQLASIDRPIDVGGPRLDLSCGWGSEVHWLTADGSGWQRVVPVGAQGGAAAKRGELIEFRLVAAGGPGLVVLGEGSETSVASIFVSADGVHWFPTGPDEQFPAGIIPSGFVIGGRVIAAVADGPSAWIGTVP
jgi:hypothetical protein